MLRGVASEAYADRLQPETYADDEVVGVFRTAHSEADAVWLSVRLFRRLTSTASGYELHVLPQLGGRELVRLMKPQVEALLDEVVFVGDRLNDKVARTTAGTLIDYLVTQLGHGDPELVVTVEGLTQRYARTCRCQRAEMPMSASQSIASRSRQYASTSTAMGTIRVPPM
jgi:hypothetical protein